MTTTTATTTVAIFITPLRPFAGVDAISGVSSSGSGASSSIDTTFGFVRDYMGDCSRAQRAARARCNSTHGLDLGPRGERYCNEGFTPVIRESSRPKRRVDGRVPHRRRGPREVQPRNARRVGSEEDGRIRPERWTLAWAARIRTARVRRAEDAPRVRGAVPQRDPSERSREREIVLQGGEHPGQIPLRIRGDG